MFFIHLLRGLFGAALGCVVALFACRWIVSQGFHAMVVPGAFLGIGFSLLSGRESRVFGFVCACLALPFSLYVEWRLFPFIADPSFEFFLGNLHHLRQLTWVMIGLGTLCAFWFGRGRPQGRSRADARGRDEA